MELTFERDGLTLRGRIDLPETPHADAGRAPDAAAAGTAPDRHPVVILMHGFTGDMGAGPDTPYTQLTRSLTESGVAVVRFDFNGHGSSDGDFTAMNVLNELNDAIQVLETIRERPEFTSIGLVGHSQGGVVAGMLAGLYPDIVDALVLLAPAATLKDDAVAGTCMGVAYDPRHIPPRVDVDGHVVGGHYFRIAQALPIYETTARFDHPALAIHGAYDAVVDAAASLRYADAMPDCTAVLYDGLDHGLYGTDREAALSRAADFLTRHLS
ncbi:cinnamoyl ester hydrolase [Bifidobacterium samirii]|uniref:Cinnamoyl ester hydrolase n=2 Tax=Bifidobacterium samirii TaxID=2306974 RepID=A0A430FVZ4_9BIFI|nr:alpha/beta hydrolase [Bifidobacterium samirii]RSX58151.1 cinnamoyl ester hydrolase [Bifidobacterium samirii]